MLTSNAPFQPKSDVVGALASGLCAVHCLSTPFLFVAQTCSVTGCCETSPGWWSMLDYLFIGITLVAVYFSSRNTSKSWIKYALYGSWAVLTLLIVNEKLELAPLSELWKYGAAFALVGLHLYNLKYCQCDDPDCCVNT
ncbi:MAG: MerC domain-containing protein [Bacteroidota bacterium]